MAAARRLQAMKNRAVVLQVVSEGRNAMPAFGAAR